MSLTSPTVLFSKLHIVLLYGWLPTVIVIGMNIEPKPSWWDLVNILE